MLRSMTGVPKPEAVKPGNPKHVFISGIARSGTTLVANLLNAQSDAIVWSDSLAGPLICADRFGGFDARLTARQRDVALSWLDMQLQGLPHSTRIKPGDFDTVGAFYKQLLDEIASPTTRLVGHKVNGYGAGTAVFEQLLEQTDVRCVYVLRDVRDVVLSQSHHLHATTTHLETWKAAAKAAWALRTHPKLVVVRYEDLVRAPAKAVESLSRMLGIDIDVDLAQLRYRDQPWIENSAFHDVDRVFDTRPVERWREHVDDELVRYAAWSCASELRLWGYPPFPVSFRPREVLAFTRQRALREAVAALSRAKSAVRDWSRPRAKSA